MKYDGKVDVAFGLSVKSKKWKNKNVYWSELVERLSTALKTGETTKEYHAASKGERSKIKDVGGYVGAYLRGGRRIVKNVIHRQLLTLDLDYATLDFWDTYAMLFDNAAVLHSTHSHTDENPRFRLIMPINREVSPDEYGAISRKVASNLGIELFDATTFETHRLMFLPSISADVEYNFSSLDAPWLDADEILDSYIDWTDTSLWPTTKKQIDDLKNLSDKQEDPELKRGIVGAFCRTFDIHEAIEAYLPDVYETTEDPNRYTYVDGSTSAGLVIYEDKYAFSHHGTDPISGKLCNAFDLVRNHKFGHLDPAGTSAAKSKSFKAMEALARRSSDVKSTLALETFTTSAKEDFKLTDEEAQANVDWAKKLDVDARGNYLSSAHNLNLIFANDPKLKGLFKFNTFDNKRYLVDAPIWRKIETPEPLKNVDYSGIRNYIEVVYKITGVNKIEDSLALEFEKRAYHPIKEYLTGLSWDGEERLDTLLIDYFGAEDTLYTREAIRKTLVAAVARVFDPGVKFDLVLTLCGEQGTGKSTLVNKLGRSWASDTFTTVSGKDSFEQLQGAWLIEIAELAGLRKAEVESIKHFISKQVDSYRPAYGKTVETYRRQCVFIGTTNNKAFLRDPTGNRRFLPVDIKTGAKSIFEISDDTVDQIWAEAKAVYDLNEKLYLSKEAEAMAKQEQRNHRDEDERTGIIEAYINRRLPVNWDSRPLETRQIFLDSSDVGTEERQYLCVAEIWAECLGKPLTDMDRYKTRGINEIVRGLEGWQFQKSPRNFSIYGKQKYYKRLKL